MSRQRFYNILEDFVEADRQLNLAASAITNAEMRIHEWLEKNGKKHPNMPHPPWRVGESVVMTRVAPEGEDRMKRYVVIHGSDPRDEVEGP